MSELKKTRKIFENEKISRNAICANFDNVFFSAKHIHIIGEHTSGEIKNYSNVFLLVTNVSLKYPSQLRSSEGEIFNFITCG